MHTPSTFASLILACRKAIQNTGIGLRFHVRDIYSEAMTLEFPHERFRFWKLDDCERANEERMIIANWSAYYEKCLKFVRDTVLNDDFANQDLTDKQVKWLWGIKRDLKDALND